jgi:L-ascorbate metabolism protein UlaG (beta-lactamase superfamily)
MKIRYNGHSCFTIITDSGTVIVSDPYEPGSYDGGIGYDPIDVTPDIVTISHDHPDHNYTAGFSNDFIEVRGDGEAKGFTFEGLEVFHDESEGSERGMNTIIIMNVEGVRICHLGDLGHTLSSEQIATLGAIDVLLLPIGGTFTIGPDRATKIFTAVKPRVTIPMHFKTKKCGFPIDPVTAFTEGKTNVREMPVPEIEINAGSLPSSPEIVVLKHYH